MTIDSPSHAEIKAEVDPTFRAARVTLRPQDFRGPNNSHVGGHFRRAFTTGALTTPLAAGGALFAARWTNADRAVLINRIRAWASIGTVFTTAQEVSVDLARVNAFVTADTGGTAIELGEDNRKERSHMKASGLSNVRVATVGALTPGTGIEEAPSAVKVFDGLLNVVGSMAGGELFNIAPGVEHPFTCQNLEGFRIRNRVAFGAAGVVVMTFEIDWLEIPTTYLGE